MSRKMIAISEKTYHNLAELGNLEDSFDSVIARLVQKQKAASGQQPLDGSAGQ
jgi:predicted CopG family antitoxin